MADKHADKTQEYQDQAERCRAMAAKAGKPELREGWLKLSRSWLDMIPKDPADESSQSQPQSKKPKRLIWPGN